MSESGRFDPKEHLVKVKGGQLYLEVRWRLIWLREEHPDASVEVELIHLDLDRMLAVARATVTLPNGTRASDIGSETERDFPAGWIEKASTKAVGRALAALGFGTQFALEMDEGESMAESPVPPRAPAPPRQRPPTAARALSEEEGDKEAAGQAQITQGQERKDTDEALLSGLRAEVVALLEHDGAALELLRAKGTLPPEMSAQQLRKAKDWLLERERRNVPLSVRLSRAIDEATTPEALRGAQQAVQNAKDSKGVSQAEYVSLLRDAERRRTELSGPLTAGAHTRTRRGADPNADADGSALRTAQAGSGGPS